jgi:hypothetical protein
MSFHDAPASAGDQRFAGRVPYASELIVLHGNEAWRTALLDVSAGGCGAFRPDDCTLEVDLLVRLFIMDGPGHAVGVDARVAREDDHGLGFEYLEPQALPPQPDIVPAP